MRIYSHQVSKDKDDCILQHMNDSLEKILLIAISTLKRRMKNIFTPSSVCESQRDEISELVEQKKLGRDPSCDHLKILCSILNQETSRKIWLAAITLIFFNYNYFKFGMIADETEPAYEIASAENPTISMGEAIVKLGYV